MALEHFKSSNKGFSLIEIVVTIAVFAILSVVSLNLFLNATVGSTKNNSSRVIKQTGDHIISLLESSLRSSSGLELNADEPQVVCQNNMSSISYINANSGDTETWEVSDEGILLLNNEAVTGSDITFENNRLIINCNQDQTTGVTLVSISFTLSRGSTEDSQEFARETFQTTVSLRNK